MPKKYSDWDCETVEDLRKLMAELDDEIGLHQTRVDELTRDRDEVKELLAEAES